MDPSFQASIAVSLYRLQVVRARLMTDTVYLDVGRTMERTRRVHPYKVVRYSGVIEMVRVTLAFFVYIGAAVAGLLCGMALVQLVIAVLLVLGAWPLYKTFRGVLENAAERRGYINALRWAQSHLQQSDDPDTP